MKELPLNDLRKALNRIASSIPGTGAGFQDEVQMRGEFTFTLIDAETGEIDQQVELNSLVDVGRNEILRFLADRPRTVSGYTFSGDGATTQFNLPHPFYPVDRIYNVTVDGASQTEHSDFSVDYRNGEIHFNSAPSSGTDNISVDVDYFQHPFRWLAVGTDGTAVSDSDTGCISESERVELDPNTNNGEYAVDEAAVEVTGTWLFGEQEANVSIAEASLMAMPGTSGAAGSSDDDALNRTVVSPTIDKSSSQQLKVTWTLSM